MDWMNADIDVLEQELRELFQDALAYHGCEAVGAGLRRLLADDRIMPIYGHNSFNEMYYIANNISRKVDLPLGDAFREYLKDIGETLINVWVYQARKEKQRAIDEARERVGWYEREEEDE